MTFNVTGSAKTLLWVGVALLALCAVLIVILPPVLGGIGGDRVVGQTAGVFIDLLVRLVREIGAPLGAAFIGAALVIGHRTDSRE
ncbi:hypothetical protein ESP57_10745 [Agromyces fucosus]|uniref:Uncharacterized protein n=1 Tax=Agromyces fucosus TaxID=41985 RepID=A0A4V1QSS2_9MICO|nr:hypothetical protein [Agromyces fucosus]RXZ49383.1 hypothetical protein ESP57_10745 [Agromyces fucosus]